MKQERRRYIRLDSVFPVNFKLLSLSDKQDLSGWIQGFTNNVGKGGICLVVNNLKEEYLRFIKEKNVEFLLDIEIPLGNSVRAEAEPVWIKKDASLNRILIGLNYIFIQPHENSKIMRYAWTKKLFLPLSLAIFLILVAFLGINFFINLKLFKANKALVKQLVSILQESSLAKQEIKKIDKEKKDLEDKLHSLEISIQSLSLEKEKIEKTKTEEIKKLNLQIEELTKEKNNLQEKIILLQNRENLIAEELLRLDQKREALEKANLEKMYQWIKVHQNPRTGLVISFEGDPQMKNWSFTYDQSLAIQIFSFFNEFARAKKILDFFKYKAKRKDGFFLNAYYANDGFPSEYIIHAGPNLWLGIAICQYTYKSKDKSYLDLAKEIASAVLVLQDQEGGIRGGPEVDWYSTEHNLDAYAFFNMLYRITQESFYLKKAEEILDWLLKHTYDRPEPPIKRGKGDSTIATDTYAWSIAAVGPEKLEALGMNPDQIMEFAENTCSVEVDFRRPDGEIVKIKGFDFAPQTHTARGGVVSSEWTAQMVLSFKIMADYYYNKQVISKARFYEKKAQEYLNNLAKMIISSPSPSGQGQSCLPYATQDLVDTGHGWFTPKGNSTGSLSGTIYTLFAYYNYNPLELK